VLATPLLRVMRAGFPSAQIDFVVRKEYGELVRYNKNLSHVYEFDAQTGTPGLRILADQLRSEQYDLVVDIHNSMRSRYLRAHLGVKNLVSIDKRVVARTLLVKFKKNIYRDVVSVSDRYIEPVKIFGIRNDNAGLELHIPGDLRASAARSMAAAGIDLNKKTIGFCPSAKHATKCWQVERFKQLGARLVKDLNAQILIFGGPDDRDKCFSIAKAINSMTAQKCAADLSAELSLLETASALSICNVVVTNDSGLMHIAAAMKRNIVALFGSTVREFGFFPVGTRSIVLERIDLPCRPCSHIGLDSCPKKHFKCMKDIEVDEVYNSVLSLSS